mmetsp:Transcript_67166/g.207700  ORF Transcript_67166/g.207700 Transcript_67166/m.207700 type:complete len:364 (-) Transcript_67166:414-1505(-)
MTRSALPPGVAPALGAPQRPPARGGTRTAPRGHPRARRRAHARGPPTAGAAHSVAARCVAREAKRRGLGLLRGRRALAARGLRQRGASGARVVPAGAGPRQRPVRATLALRGARRAPRGRVCGLRAEPARRPLRQTSGAVRRAEADRDVLDAVLLAAEAHVKVVRVTLGQAVAQPGPRTGGLLPSPLPEPSAAARVLEEAGRQPRGRRGVVPREAEEVDGRHGEERRVPEEVGVVLHPRRRDQQLPGSAPLEEPQRVLRRDETVALAVDEERRAGDIGYNLAVWEALGEGPGEEAPDDALDRGLDRGEGRDEDQAADGVLRRQEHSRTAAQGAAEEDDLRVAHADLIDQEAERGESNLIHTIL